MKPSRYVLFCAKYIKGASIQFSFQSAQKRMVASKVALTGDWFCATGVGNADEFFYEDRVLLMVPVTDDYCVLLIVGVYLLLWTNHDRCAQTVNIVPLRKRVSPKKHLQKEARMLTMAWACTQ